MIESRATSGKTVAKPIAVALDPLDANTSTKPVRGFTGTLEAGNFPAPRPL
jgi:hypothetical protein